MLSHSPSVRTAAKPAESANHEDLSATDSIRSERARHAARVRHASGRRRNVDPATTERQYSEQEWEFMRAIQEYKQSSGRMFPTWSEVLEVAKGLGYERQAGG